MLTPRENSPLPKMSPEEDRTRDAVDSEPKHYQLSYSGPRKENISEHLAFDTNMPSDMTWSVSLLDASTPWLMGHQERISKSLELAVTTPNTQNIAESKGKRIMS